VITLSDLVGGLSASLVYGRAQADHAALEVAARYRAEPLLQGARVPRMLLSEVTIQLRFAVNAAEGEGIEVLATAEELAGVPYEQATVLTLKFKEDDLEPPAPSVDLDRAVDGLRRAQRARERRETPRPRRSKESASRRPATPKTETPPK
jgi:hypothetical protein